VRVVPHRWCGSQDYHVPCQHVPSTHTEFSSKHKCRRPGLTCTFIDHVSNCECLEHRETEIDIECANKVGVYIEGSHHDMARHIYVYCLEDFYKAVPRRMGESEVV
jgi:hypothetical protein